MGEGFALRRQRRNSGSTLPRAARLSDEPQPISFIRSLLESEPGLRAGAPLQQGGSPGVGEVDHGFIGKSTGGVAQGAALEYPPNFDACERMINFVTGPVSR